MKIWIGPALILSVAFYACNDITEQDDAKRQRKTTISKPVKNGKGGVLHNIVVQESGDLQISHAYLAFENGILLPRTNTVSVSEEVYLNLVIDKSKWVDNRQVTINASQSIVTNKGEPVLNVPNLLENVTLANTNDRERIFLRATITKTRPDIDYFIIDFRVWDIKGKGEVKGSYKLYVEN